jgi:phage terminase large subunit GpA-like protein
MEDFADNKLRSISVMCSAQSAKTETMLALLAWLIAEDPGPTMWVTANEDEALKFCTERLMPSLRNCPLVAKKIPKSVRLAKAREIFFPGMALEVLGANAPSKLQSKPRRWLLLDEVRNWPPGALPMVLKRTRTFWNARQCIISTPGSQHDHVHQNFLSGDQREWQVKCPKCKKDHKLDWEFMRWDSNEKTKPKGRYDFDNLSRTIRMECPDCGYQTKDTPSERRRLTKGRWVAQNPGCPSNRRSYTWNAILPTWVPWKELVEEFLSAKKALSWGDPEPLKTFITESLGQPWEDRLKYGDKDYLYDRREDYELLEAWGEEDRRFLAVDVQLDHLYYVCRAFGKNGSSRLIDNGKIFDFDELKEKIRQLNVDADDVCIDSGYKASAVYNEVTKSDYTWKPFKGDDSKFYMVDGVRQIWKDVLIDPAIGTALQGSVRPLRLFHFSNPAVKDLLTEYIQGIGPVWTLPSNISKDYESQMKAEHRDEVVNAYGEITYKWVNKPRRPNHYWDCECMLTVAGLVTECLGLGA